MTDELRLRTTGPADTRALAGALAEQLAVGDAVTLTGELGAGKTCFVQGAAAALGVERRVTSPTFTLVRSYQGDVPVIHVDVYRLDRLQDVIELGEETVFDPDHVTFIEWGDAVAALLPADRIEVEILLDDGEEDRTVVVRGQGRWAGRMTELGRALGRWQAVA